jgi:hypothetical protein
MTSPTRAARRATGIYYTPAHLVDFIIERTIRPLLHGKTTAEVSELRILDPACGAGYFLVRACQLLLDWHRDQYLAEGSSATAAQLERRADGWRLRAAERLRLLQHHIYGLDIDARAVRACRRALLQIAAIDSDSVSLTETIRCGNALVGPDGGSMIRPTERRGLKPFDWHAAFPAVWNRGGFDVVLGNPPWGQKGITAGPAIKRYLVRKYPSSAGIADLFRPFVELGVRLTAPSGMFGMVLPDVILLKDYPQTRLYLLDHLTLTAIDWWGRAFPGAMIDAATIIGRKSPTPAAHRVNVAVHDRDGTLRHSIPQADFRANPRHVFNLFLTPDRRRALEQLAGCPRLGDYFEIHEGIHSGNIRAELFIAHAVDSSCRELIFGRDEIISYVLRWKGKYVRLAAEPEKKTRQRYANLGRREWHEREKILVRRTGDHVLAAVDRERRHASNNFFLIFPKQPCSLDLDGLCALLNSRWMTWFFRTIEPRRGRMFAELKIKHLRTFPLPVEALTPGGCDRLNRLGVRRIGCPDLDAEIEALVLDLFGIEPAE